MKKIRGYKKIKIEMSQKDFFDMVVQKNISEVQAYKDEQTQSNEYKYRHDAIRVEIEYIDGFCTEGKQNELEPWNHGAIMDPQKIVKQVTVIDRASSTVVARLTFK